MTRRRWLAPALVIGATVITSSTVVGGCRGPDVDFSCDDFADDFAEIAELEARINPIDEVPTWGPYPVNMVLSAEGINGLLGSQVDTNVPFTGDLSFGPSNIHFEPISAPVIEIAEEGACGQCVYFSLDFVAELVQNNQPVSAGIGFVKLEVPIRLEPKDNGATGLVAAYDKAEIQEMELSAFGFDSEEHDALAGALEVLMTESVQEQFGPTELMELGSFDLGAGEAKLLAREMFTYADTQSITIGMHTNLVMPSDFGLDPKAELPEGTKMGFQFSTGLLLGMSRRMLAEGEIPRTYDDDGNPDPDGIYSATIDDMTGNEVDSEFITARIRIWRLAESYCGYALADLPMAVEVDAAAGNLSVSPGTIVVLEGEGVGAIAAEEKDLVDQNRQLVEIFKAELANAMGDTLDYGELNIEGKVIVFDTLGVSVTPDAVHTHLDFLVVDAP